MPSRNDPARLGRLGPQHNQAQATVPLGPKAPGKKRQSKFMKTAVQEFVFGDFASASVAQVGNLTAPQTAQPPAGHQAQLLGSVDSSPLGVSSRTQSHLPPPAAFTQVARDHAFTFTCGGPPMLSSHVTLPDNATLTTAAHPGSQSLPSGSTVSPVHVKPLDPIASTPFRPEVTSSLSTGSIPRISTLSGSDTTTSGSGTADETGTPVFGPRFIPVDIDKLRVMTKDGTRVLVLPGKGGYYVGRLLI